MIWNKINFIFTVLLCIWIPQIFPKKLHLQKPTVKTRRSLGLANGHDILSMTGLAATGRCVHFPALVRPQRYMWVHTYKKHGWNLTHACTPIVSKLSVLEYCQVSSQQIYIFFCSSKWEFATYSDHVKSAFFILPDIFCFVKWTFVFLIYFLLLFSVVIFFFDGLPSA